MEVKLRQNEQADVEEDYLLLDLDSVCVQGDIPANASYVLSGLDTQNPVLTIANHLKLIGEYQETMGTCYVFSEKDGVTQVMHSENHISETNFPKDTSITNSTQLPAKELKLITGLHRVLKFRLASEDESQSAKQKQC
ncbi:uncharacterized protein LOC120250004 [Dioscorea cayenensis subsp. rotundata]|uniref:Uncharacterized protein LOC120250004 n=1 Tax=Dioscorea cayennensis subsp. rotundata TaxID=55577 RepID=A0AB40AK67_DIOCR|nr:uncharacterized protein LOC120250004 [Dioscorea cayenensis subsp. rotundata]XP_039114660.1 uncharacterized protein LOC120250004 [Dioscorea cayenensis subsp. rotundata]XP_039114661.1 uncharacterized protein LOC120250004 [Dioscorea cayenensis subsp. rotundata]XP_039114662.1 uncharacterized protein LOC120250004 [Dioscorea cayenensis subsp. rotundata]XP_039114663.1 uncharacterized protein LOC120250004 [Dioscorea cayenensis subsp. rotundata]XP_039114664.1 uncharacterized protein LOC120250004 [Di